MEELDDSNPSLVHSSQKLPGGDGKLVASEGASDEGAIAVLDATSLSELIQDQRTTMGLAMNAKVKMVQGAFDAWIGWEPVFRALLDARPVHEAGAIELRDRARLTLRPRPEVLRVCEFWPDKLDGTEHVDRRLPCHQAPFRIHRS